MDAPSFTGILVASVLAGAVLAVVIIGAIYLIMA